MVHDFIEQESSPPIFPASSNCLAMDHQAKYFALQEILGKMTEAEAKVLDSVLKHMRSNKEVEKTSSFKKWLVMNLKIDGFNASICQTSWVTSLGCPAGDYEYIEIIVLKEENGKTKSSRLIVDIEFRSQFELARPTPSYKELTDTLPTIFIGSEEKLNNIISLLCSAAKQSLRERGLYVPPWRTTTYMQSKWLKVTANSKNNIGYRENKEAKSGSHHGFSIWSPPMVKPKRRDLSSGGGGSALSSQFSNMGINCC
ncbi:hypothetical protein GH714_021320 [Hevea brasiliensis]|uniref:DUF506 family protein n=1 Tax=Hevea brasiliensis TaxID=3981 RepID=A0A6A6K6K4_HEVBR|nr:hypothetical protein GH714_021320 [Hevea brasiliensis]